MKTWTKLHLEDLAGSFACFASCCIRQPGNFIGLGKTQSGPTQHGIAPASPRPLLAPVSQGLLAVVLFLFTLAAPTLVAQIDDHNPVGAMGTFEGVVTSGCAYNVLNHSTQREVDDIVVAGSIGKYPLKMTRYYVSRDFGYSRMGPGWRHEYSWNFDFLHVRVEYANGNVQDSTCEPPVGVSDWPISPGGQYPYGAFRLADGGTVVSDSLGRESQIIDPYGQTTNITYASDATWMKVTEPGGRYLYFIYTHQPPPNGALMLTRVEAHGLGNSTVTDWVNYTYTSTPTGGLTIPTAMCLTSVAYSDGTSATYTYENDNCPDQPTRGSFKAFPPVSTCNDVRYHGAMRRIAYDYDQGGPHGAIIAERYSNQDGVKGITVSSISPTLPSPLSGGDAIQMPADFTETRGDTPSRTFYYTSLNVHRTDDGSCPTLVGSPSQFIQSYTDFQGHTTYVGYDNHWYVNSVTDARGTGQGDPNYTTTYARASPPPYHIGEITKITHPDGTHIDYTYQPESGGIGGHYVATVSNERQKVTTYRRDPTTHLVTRIDYPSDASTPASYEEFTYNSFGQVLTHHLRNTAWESFVYDSRGLLTDKYNPKSGSVAPGGSDPHIHYSYYTSGPWTDRVQTMTLPPNFAYNLQATETYEYDRALGADGTTNPTGTSVGGRGLVTKITHTDNTYQSFGYDAYGNKRWEENELRYRTNYTYDDYKRMLTDKNPLNKTISYTYTPTNGGGGSSYKHTTGNPDTVTTPAGIVTSNVYDQNFRKTSSTAAYGTTLAAATLFHYDAVGNQDYITNPRNYITYTDYDSRNRKWQVREPLSRTTQFYYDDGINITRIVRPDQTTETKTYDAMNRVLTDTVPKTSSPLVNLTTSFTYNPSGTVQKITDPNGHYTWLAYDASDRKNSMTYNDGSTQGWSYDPAGNLEYRISVDGTTKFFSYDNRNRLNATTWSNWNDTTRNPDWGYFDHDAAGQLTEAENGISGWGASIISDVHRSYDAAGHLTLDEQIVTGLGTYDVHYPNYDDDGNLTRMYVAGVADYDFTFSYDAMGRFEKIFTTNGGQLFQYYYDAASNETERHNLVNGVNQVYPRDALNRIQYMDAVKGASTLSHEWYTYDVMNRINVVTYAGGGTDSFIYYLDGEVNQATLGNLGHTLTYNLDKMGNRTSVVDNNVTSTYTPNTINQYNTGAGISVSNGPEHEIQSYNGVAYTYMNDERLEAVSDGTNTYSLTYDALGRCVKHSLTGAPDTYYIYDGEKAILEYNSAGGRAGYSLYGKGIDEILKRGANGSDNTWHWYYFNQNRESSVTILTDFGGNVLERYRYDAFGAPTVYTATWGVLSNTMYDNRFLFTGREYAATYRGIHNTPAFNFYEYRARAYNPKLGRFMSEDPKVFDAGDYNLFRYCHNDPVDSTDPMGTEQDYAQTVAPVSGNHPAQAVELGKQMAHLQALQKALGWPGYGAIQMGQVNYAIAQTGVQLRASYAQINQDKLSQLGSAFRPMASHFVGSANEMLNPEGYEVKIADQGGYRSFVEQTRLRTISDAGGPHANKPGESAHNYGAAVDIDIIKGSRANEDIGRHTYNSLIGRLGALGEGQGLIWGGHFTHPDPPHFQHPGIPVNGPDMLRLHQQLLQTTSAGLEGLMGVP